MAKNKYYAVKNGKKIGIFDNWADCSKQVHGFPGAIYKGFPTLAEAEKYFNGQESKESKYYETEELMGLTWEMAQLSLGGLLHFLSL